MYLRRGRRSCHLIILLLFTVVGLCLGLLGAGGGILTLPLLVHFAGMDPHDAVPLSLAIVGAAGLFGALVSARRGRVAAGTALWISAGGIPGARLGAALSPRVPNEILLICFAVVMAVAGIAMWRRSRRATPPSSSLPPQHEGRESRSHAALRLLPIGLGVGVLTGFLGVGGGFLIVPALTLVAGLDMRRATGTSLAVIVVNSAAGLWGHSRGELVPWTDAGVYVGMAILGMAGGLRVARHLPARRLEQVFAVFVLGMAVVVGITNLLRLLHGDASAGLPWHQAGS